MINMMTIGKARLRRKRQGRKSSCVTMPVAHRHRGTPSSSSSSPMSSSDAAAAIATRSIANSEHISFRASLAFQQQQRTEQLAYELAASSGFTRGQLDCWLEAERHVRLQLQYEALEARVRAIEELCY